jgi:hypothetical protein
LVIRLLNGLTPEKKWFILQSDSPIENDHTEIFLTLPLHAFLKYVVIALLSLSSVARAQQLECGVNVNYESVSTTHKDLLANFGADIQYYLNNYPWGPDSDIKVSCNMSIFIQSVIGENRYSAQVAIVSQRERLGSEKNTAMVRLKDDQWEFTYVQNRPLNHNPSDFNDLTSFLDFYAFLILGYDYDSYEPLGGTDWFRKASDVANLGRSRGQQGWQGSTGTYSRTQLIDDILNPTLTPVRLAGYEYHFAGLDSLMLNPNQAYERILKALEGIGEARKKSDPRNLAMRVFFDAKHLEIAELFQNYPDPGIYRKLGQIDPMHISTYEGFKHTPD